MITDGALSEAPGSRGWRGSGETELGEDMGGKHGKKWEELVVGSEEWVQIQGVILGAQCKLPYPE